MIKFSNNQKFGKFMETPEKCDICKGDGRLYFEQDERFNKNKFWTCIKCTGILGLINESPEMLERLISYLK